MYKNDDQESIVCEIKKSIGELKTLVDNFVFLSKKFLGRVVSFTQEVKPNSLKKRQQMVERKPRVLWLLRPNGFGSVFTLVYAYASGQHILSRG